MRLTISYNPYLLESAFLIDGEAAADRSWASYLRRRRLQTWFYSAPNWRGMAVELGESLNEGEIEVEFEGRELDYAPMTKSVGSVRRSPVPNTWQRSLACRLYGARTSFPSRVLFRALKIW